MNKMYPGNHVKSKVVNTPLNLRTRKSAPTTHLAYITPEEAGILAALKPGTPHKGPHGIPNYDSWDYDATTKKPSFTSGAQASAQEARNRGDTSQDRKNYSYSTRDVRSSPTDRQEFRDRTGSTITTEAENISRAAHQLTNDPKWLNMPIFIPKGYKETIFDEETGTFNADPKYDDLFELYNKSLETGNNELFFEALEDLEDITAGNPDIDKQLGYGTTHDDWYDTSVNTFAGGYPSSYGSGSGYGNDIAAYYGAGLSQNPKQLGPGESAIPSTELLDYMIRVNKYNPYTKQAMAKDGGLLSLLR
jgi:hypothetical protein